MLADFAFILRRILKRGFAGLFTPGQQFLIIICPVRHHAGREFTGDDVVHMFLEQRRHNGFQLFGERISAQFRRVGKAIHHQRDPALFQRFGDGFPAELNQFFCIRRVCALFHQLVEAQQRTGLQHTAQNGLLAHQVRFHFRHERRLQHACTVTAGCRGPRFGNRHALALRIVFRVYRDKRRHAETTFVLFTHLGARTFRRYHHDGDVFTDLLAYFNDVKAVGVTQRGTVFHQRLHGAYNIRVLFVRRQVNDQIRLRDKLFISANLKTIFRRLAPGGALLGDRFFTQGIGNIQTGITHVQPLVEPLRAATHDDYFFTFEVACAVGELIARHKTAFAQLRQLLTQIQSIEVVSHGDTS
ncbi:hypothetical protein BN129_3573 [Cronobacter sakazakii 701]|nr:hypothetical protein BN129_3573 [Cronobacter sakazakii 701]